MKAWEKIREVNLKEARQKVEEERRRLAERPPEVKDDRRVRLEREAERLRAFGPRMADLVVVPPCVRCGRPLGDASVVVLPVVGVLAPLAHRGCAP